MTLIGPGVTEVVTASGKCEVSAVSHKGLALKGPSGEPATLAIVDAQGNILDMGCDVEHAVWDTSIGSYRNFLRGRGALRVVTPVDHQKFDH